MATKMKRLSLYLRTFALLVWTSGGEGYNCPYGHNCAYEPAPPGRAPACALPGLTFCVHPDPYPEQKIRQLVEAGQYDISTLLSDESKDDFGSLKKDYPYGYGPNSIPHVDQISLVNDPVFTMEYNGYNHKFHSYEHDIFSQRTPLQPPSPVDPSPYNKNTFSTNFSKLNSFRGIINSISTPNTFWNPQTNINNFNTGYDKKIFRQNGINSNAGFNPSSGNQNLGGFNQNYYNVASYNPNYVSSDWFRQAAGGSTPYNPNEWWRYVSPSRSDVTIQRSISFPTRTTTLRRNSTLAHNRNKRNAALIRASEQRQLTGSEALSIALGLNNEDASAERPRRQTGNVEELCRVRTQYVTPRAALNNKGSWKYIVNMPSNMTQLVRAEICASTTCSGLCSVPLGYTTRCEQKYLQKRLVALESNGQKLYTDVFWIPSCCQCTVIANNN